MTEIEVTKNLLLDLTCRSCYKNSKYNCPHLQMKYVDELKKQYYYTDNPKNTCEKHM